MQDLYSFSQSVDQKLVNARPKSNQNSLAVQSLGNKYYLKVEIH